MKYNFSGSSRKIDLFNIFNILFMLSICFITLYPVWNVLISSFNEGRDAARGGLYWLPRIFTFENYGVVFSDDSILRAFGISVARTVLGASISVFITAMVAYGISHKELIGRNFYLALGTVTLFFNGGLIPYFLVIKNLGLYDTFAVYIVNHLFLFYNMVIFQAYFRQLPSSVEESAKIDGANDFIIFIRLILPLSKPILAVFLLYAGVYHWNDYIIPVIYTQNTRIQPVQTLLYRIISEQASDSSIEAARSGVDIGDRTITVEAVRMATMVVVTFPIVCVYPFLQKYFVKGFMVGAIKG